MDYGNIRLCYKIESENDVVLSDEKTQYKQGFIKKSSLYYGEVHDYNGYDYSWNTLGAEKDGWKTPNFCRGMEEVPMYIQKVNTDKIISICKAVKVKEFDGYCVYDTGKNITGYAVIKCMDANQSIKIQYAENLNEDKTLNCDSAGWEQIGADEFITDGKTELLYPRFLWHGFRYFSLTNNAQVVEVREVHSDIAVTSSFECSDDTINWLYKTYIHTQLSNIHSGVMTDCPHRERLGYTGDGQICAPAGMITLDSQELYRKWIYDIIDCQDKTTGHVQHTAPFAGGGGGPAGWGGAIISVIYYYTKYFGDKSLLKEFYPNMELFVDYMESRCEKGIIVREEEKGWCLGDWCTPEKIEIPEPFVNTCLFVAQLEMMRRCAVLLEKPTERFEKLTKHHINCLKEKYPQDKNGSFLNGLQGADLFAYNCGLGNDKTLKTLNKKYSELKMFDTGIFGTFLACEVLFRNNFADTAIELLRSDAKDHSFGHMKNCGATTLWEDWDGKASHNHPMFGACVKALFEYILGIRQSRHSYGYEKIIIEPAKNNILDYAKGYINTVKGKIAVEYRKTGKGIEFNVELCTGVSAELRYDGNRYPLFEGTNSIIC